MRKIWMKSLLLLTAVVLFCGDVQAAKPRKIDKVKADDAANVLAGDVHDGKTQIALDSPEAVAKRLAWWTDARFGMFIHWGLIAQWGGCYPAADGELIEGGDFMPLRLRLSNKLYERIAHVFNPVKFDADQIVLLAKSAGMKYIVFTAKHHDGFAMYNSPSDDYNIVKQTPWGRDPVAELAKACQRHGIKFGVYYSLGRDWHDPDVPTDINKKDDLRRSNFWDYPHEDRKDFSKYFERKAKPQIRELLTQYGPISVLWFDTPEKTTPEQSEELVRLVHGIQPDCIINPRVGNRRGDYLVHEMRVPKGKALQPWETCTTINRSWFYGLNDHNWKTSASLVRMLVDIAGKGGNLLLDIGPTGEGVNPAPSTERLMDIGRWMKVNGESIYGTKASPWKPFAWGRCTCKKTDNGTTLYFSVFDWPADGKLVIPGLKNEVLASTLLATGEALKTSAAGDKLTIVLPPSAPDPVASVIKVEVKGEVDRNFSPAPAK